MKVIMMLLDHWLEKNIQYILVLERQYVHYHNQSF